MSQELEDRFHNYGVRVRDFCIKLKRDIINTEYIRQVIRASGSVGGNYIEASDERMRIKISRREAKESIHWLDLILTDGNDELEKEPLELMDEGIQIKKILSAILKKLEP